MKELTTKQIMDWVSKAKLQGISPNTLIISKPDTPSIRIAGKEVYCSARPLIHTIMGIEIWVDASIEKDKAYLIDKESIVAIENMNERFDELADLKERKRYFQENYRDWKIEAVEAYKNTLIRDIGAYYWETI